MSNENENNQSALESRTWVVSVSWAATILCGLRIALIFGMDHFAHGVELKNALWRTCRAFGLTLAVSLGCALAGAALLASTRRSSRGVRAGVLLVVAALFAWVLSGFGIDLPTRVPGIDNNRGYLAWGVIAGSGILLALGVAICDSKLRAGTIPRLATAAPWVLLLIAGALTLIVPTPRIVVREVARALLEHEDAWQVERSGDAGEPEVGVLTPAIHWRFAGGERPALIVPPGGEVSFRVSEEDGHVTLRTAAGIDMKSLEKRFRGVSRIELNFEVLVDGELVSATTIAIHKQMLPEENEWKAIGGDRGIELRPGNVVHLKTTLTSDPPDAKVEAFAWRIGFSDPRLERRREWPRAMSSPENPNIVLIVQDTQRSDRLGCYGYDRDTSPNIDRLAARGTLFERASAASSWTWPSTASILSGLSAEQHGVLDDESCYLARNVELVSEALQRRGYSTAGFSGSPLISPSKNFDQGFETYDAGGQNFRKSHVFVPKALEWMETYAGQRFFLYLHLVDPHDPHQPSPAAREKFIPGSRPTGMPPAGFTGYTWALRKGRARPPGMEWDTTRVVPLEHQEWFSNLYDACVQSGDYWIGEILDTISDLGLEDETVVAFTSDHGEEFFDHGMLEHGHSLYRELVQVPLILAGPGIPPGVRSDAVISNRHLAFTLALLGGAQLKNVDDGLDLARPNDLKDQPVLFSTQHGWWNNWYRTPIYGVREGDWILHWAPSAGAWGARRPVSGGDLRLYDARSDSVELNDVSASESDRCAAMLESMKAVLLAQREQRTSTPIGAGEETLEMLDHIGYTDSEDEESSEGD